MSLNDLSELSRVNEELKREVSERRRAEEQLEERNKLLSTMLEVSNLVSSTMELRSLLEAILDRLKKIIDYRGAKIFAIEGEIVRVVAHRSILTPEEERNYCFPYRYMPLGKDIVIDKKPVIISDVRDDSVFARALRENVERLLHTTSLDYMRSWMGLPLIVKDRVIGVLTVDHSEPGYYLPRHAEICMAFANQAAIEFENARLYSETLKSTDELKTMFAVQQAITSRLELDAVLQLIADEARRLTLSERTAVFIPDKNDLVLSVFSGKDSKSFLGYRLPIDQSVIGQSMLSGKPVIINNAQNNPVVYRDLVVKAGVKSFLSVPMTAGTKRIGAIVMVDKLNGEFDHEDERILSMLASAAAIGIENARMYEEERRRHFEDLQRRRVAEGLRDILAILNSNRPLTEILDYIINQAVSTMDTDTGALYRFQDDEGMLKIKAACGLPEGYIKQVNVPVGVGAVGQAVLQKKPIVIPEISGSMPEDFMEDPGRKPHLTWLMESFQTLLAVPLICKDEVYGGVVLFYRNKRKFSNEEIELAMTFADQAALAIDNAKLREWVEQAAAAAERSRLARDLHDAVTQTLFSASLIAEVLPKIWERNPNEGRNRLEELRQLARGALAEMRTLLLELRPVTLVEADLEELLRHLVEAITGRARIPVTLNIEKETSIPTDVKISLYRIAQEALNNIAKHSGAGRAEVCLRMRQGRTPGSNTVEMVISDDGRGFNPDEISGEHLGVSIMRERAESIGASLKVESGIKKGTEIILCWKGLEGEG